jgi:hypothetical protein
MVERFNGRISDIVNQTRFGCASELESTLHNYVNVYNHNIPQQALKHQTPIQTLKKWQKMKPDLFVKRVYNQAGLDRFPHPATGVRAPHKPGAGRWRRVPWATRRGASGSRKIPFRRALPLR